MALPSFVTSQVVGGHTKNVVVLRTEGTVNTLIVWDDLSAGDQDLLTKTITGFGGVTPMVDPVAGHQAAKFGAAVGSDATGLSPTSAATAGTSTATYSAPLTTGSASGMTANRKYSAIVTVDGVLKSVNFLGSDAATVADVLTQVNIDLGASAVATLTGGNIVVTSATTGTSSSVSIQDSGFLFSTLPGFKSFSAVDGKAATNYLATITVDGVDKAISIQGSAAQTITTLIAEINTDLADAATAALDAGSIVVTSATTGVASKVSMSDISLFRSVTGFAGLDVAVAGAVDMLDAFGTVRTPAGGSLSQYFKIQAVDSADAGGGPGTPGPTGPQGPAGATGATGPAGPTGATGATGPAGATGAAGTPGAQGTQGIQGVPGAAGATGPAGADGATGPAGADSTVPGPAGAQGPIGPQGDTGPAGAAGATGSQGAPGADGATGSQGPVGATGPAGADSTVPGPTGPAGATGAAGTPGADGATGPQGPIGPQGTPGQDGTNGTDGATGSPGATGAQGPIGDTGPAGATGPQGAPGIDATAPQFTGTYFVTKNGSDVTGTGALYAPFQTVQKAVDVATANTGFTGAVVIVAFPGRYSEDVVIARPLTTIQGYGAFSFGTIIRSVAVNSNVAGASVFQTEYALKDVYVEGQVNQNAFAFGGTVPAYVRMDNVKLFSTGTGVGLLAADAGAASQIALVGVDIKADAVAMDLTNVKGYARQFSAESTANAAVVSTNSNMQIAQPTIVNNSATIATMIVNGGDQMFTSFGTITNSNGAGDTVALDATAFYAATGTVFIGDLVNGSTGFAVKGVAGSKFAHANCAFAAVMNISAAMTTSTFPTVPTAV